MHTFFYLGQSFNVNLIFNLVNIYCVSRGNSPFRSCVRIYHSSDLRSETRASSEAVIIGWYGHVDVCECITRYYTELEGLQGEWVSEWGIEVGCRARQPLRAYRAFDQWPMYDFLYLTGYMHRSSSLVPPLCRLALCLGLTELLSLICCVKINGVSLVSTCRLLVTGVSMVWCVNRHPRVIPLWLYSSPPLPPRILYLHILVPRSR